MAEKRERSKGAMLDIAIEKFGEDAYILREFVFPQRPEVLRHKITELEGQLEQLQWFINFK